MKFYMDIYTCEIVGHLPTSSSCFDSTALNRVVNNYRRCTMLRKYRYLSRSPLSEKLSLLRFLPDNAINTNIPTIVSITRNSNDVATFAV